MPTSDSLLPKQCFEVQQLERLNKSRKTPMAKVTDERKDRLDMAENDRVWPKGAGGMVQSHHLRAKQEWAAMAFHLAQWS